MKLPNVETEGRDFGNFIMIPREFGNSRYIHFKLAVIALHLISTTRKFKFTQI